MNTAKGKRVEDNDTPKITPREEGEVNPDTASEPYPTGAPIDQIPILEKLFPDRQYDEAAAPEPETARSTKRK
jgi:hypothetical protein